MNKKEIYDLTYITIDSLSEGVGSSQITPLVSILSKNGLKINLISFEKVEPTNFLQQHLKKLGVHWNFQEFGSAGILGGVERLNVLRRAIPVTRLIHARSDIPAVSGITSNEGPVLWDVRSLWADQKVLIEKSRTNMSLYHLYRGLESIAARKSIAMSTLTSAVVPILESRHRKLPQLRAVVPTAVNLDRFRVGTTLPAVVCALFSGTYNEYYDMDLSALFMNELRKKIKVDAHWARPLESNRTIIGVGESRVFPATQSEMAEIIPNYSFGLAICKLDAGPSLTASMPTKIGEFLACGRPVVVNKGLGDMDQFIEEFNVGVVLNGESSNTEKGASTLVNLLSDPETPSRCRALAEKYFSMHVGAHRYLELYSKMLPSPN